MERVKDRKVFVNHVNINFIHKKDQHVNFLHKKDQHVNFLHKKDQHVKGPTCLKFQATSTCWPDVQCIFLVHPKEGCGCYIQK